MRHILTTLTAATVLALALTAEANAGHHMQHNNNQQPNNNHGTTSLNLNSTMHLDKSNLKTSVNHHSDHHDRCLLSNCCDFRYRCWCPSCDTYIFWYPTDNCWYYWCASQGCYLPYAQITIYPPQANVVPQIPGGLPPVVPGGNDNGPTTGQDAPPMPPADVQNNGPPTGKGGQPSNPFDN